ncbi:MAG: Gfo/Idh/MocA family oxidoreductase [Candidatus Omnitrophica bacterium]|nr:Gfo/Idh/MocA family oxidoreductase [Candidatus Omnitrophota bacterium]
MKKIRIGMIGCGGMGQGHIKKIKELPEAQLAAVSDADPETARKIGTENNVPYFADYRKLIKSGLCDAVLIVTPHYFHHEIGIAAFKSGLHVLSEKPITVTVAAADAFLAAAKKSRKVFGVMFQQRTFPHVRLAREIIKSGRIGKIQRTLAVEPHYRSQAYYDSSTWRGTWLGEGGGVLINQSPHGIDLFMLLGGLPSRVIAKTRTKIHKIEVEDEVTALLEYPNGAWGYYYTSTCEDPASPLFMEIVGDSGKIVLTENDVKLFTFKPSISKHNATAKTMWGGPEIKEEKLKLPKTESGHKEIIRNFCAAIMGREKLLAPGAEGLWSIEFINALILSGKKEKPVNIPVNRKEYEKLLDGLKKKSKIKKVKKVERTTDPRHDK